MLTLLTRSSLSLGFLDYEFCLILECDPLCIAFTGYLDAPTLKGKSCQLLIIASKPEQDDNYIIASGFRLIAL